MAPRATVLVTGASGFVGRAAVPQLARAGYEVHAVHNAGPAPRTPGVRAHRIDLTEPTSARALVRAVRPTHLLHLAWYTEHGAYWSSDRNLQWLGASIELLRAFAATGGRRAVLAGSCAEYDWSHGVCSELTTPRRPDSAYGTCKHALHEVAMAHAATAGYSAAWARLFFPYGPREQSRRLVPTVIRGILENRPVQLSHGHQRRDFMFVDDAAGAVVRLLGSEVEGAINVGSGEARSLRELVAAIVDRAALPADLRFGALPAHDEPPLVVADTRRLREELGWEPQIKLADGLDRTIGWWRRQLYSGA